MRIIGTIFIKRENKIKSLKKKLSFINKHIDGIFIDRV